MNEKMYEGNDSSDDDEEQAGKFSELSRANTETQTLFKGVDTEISYESEDEEDDAQHEESGHDTERPLVSEEE